MCVKTFQKNLQSRRIKFINKKQTRKELNIIEWYTVMNELTEYTADIELISENTKQYELPSPAQIITHRGLSRREIYINFPIDDELLDVCVEIINWNKEDYENNIPVEQRKPIKIFINSVGGDLEITMNLLSVIEASKTPVYTIGMAKCYSSGGLILLSGHKRFIFENTCFLLHDGYFAVGGGSAKVQDTIEFNNKCEKKIKSIVLKKTNISEDEYQAKYRSDWYMTSEEIIEYGVADKIINTMDELFEIS